MTRPSLCRRAGALALLFAGAQACSPRPTSDSSALPEGVVAEVAGRPVTGELVQKTGLSPEAAVDLLVRLELFVAHVAEHDPALLRVAERASFSRSLLESLRGAALDRSGPVNAEEGAAIARRRWVELDRPRSVRTVHLVVLSKDPARRDAARAHAERLAEAVHGVSDPDAFADRARAASKEVGLPEGTELRVEALPPVAEDGRTVPVDVLDRGGPPALLVEYARAAARLGQPGDQSAVVETSYGFHVLLATEIVPELRPTPEDVLGVVREEALSLRVRPERERLVSGLRESILVEVSRNVEELTRGIWEHR